jgi:hypothetical protein
VNAMTLVEIGFMILILGVIYFLHLTIFLLNYVNHF